MTIVRIDFILGLTYGFRHEVHMRAMSRVSSAERRAAILGYGMKQICRLVLTIAFIALMMSASANLYAHDGHSHTPPNKNQAETPLMKRTIVTLAVPAIRLVRDDRKEVDLLDELQDPRPLYVNFIYTSCTSVCPVMTNIFSTLQENLGLERDNVRIMSITIDPEHDTAERLSEYRTQFEAGPGWRFYTGSTEASTAAQKAFGVYSRDKMNHPVVTFYRPAGGRHWVRLDGFASPELLAREYLSNSSQ